MADGRNPLNAQMRRVSGNALEPLMFHPMNTDPELLKLLAEAAAKVKAMSPAEQEAMFKAQREGIVRAEMSWPRSNYKWVNGVKVYDSLDDYYND